MTRRILKPQPTENEYRKIGVIDQRHGENDGLYYTWLDREAEGKSKICDDYNPETWKCPYGTIGDRLWVREPFAMQYFDDNSPAYRADFTNNAREVVKEPKWKPPIHMPRSVSRITLEITNVRVERLNKISGKDCIAEGVVWKKTGLNDGVPLQGDLWVEEKNTFKTLWESINGKGSWEANPWVWVIEFNHHNK